MAELALITLFGFGKPSSAISQPIAPITGGPCIAILVCGQGSQHLSTKG
jgi:hypothetical protein